MPYTLRLVEEQGKRAVFESSEDHTLFLILLPLLEADETVREASFAIDHPLVGKPRLILEVKKGSPVEALARALAEAEKELNHLKKKVEKVLNES